MSENLIQEIKINKVDKTEENKKKIDFPSNHMTTGEIKVSHKKPSGRKGIIIIGILIIILGIIFHLANYFAFSKIVLTNKTMDVVLENEEFKFKKGNGFEIMIVSDDSEKDVLFTESKKTETYAKGIVVLYNEYSSRPQNLLIDTRLEDNEGRIYMTNERTTIPGMKNSVPGSVEVGITAQKTGVEYNGEPRDFKIIGFKGSSKYDKYYARSKGEITGGVSGLVYYAGENQLEKIEAEASKAFYNSLIKKLKAQIPNGYLWYPTASNYLYELKNIENSKTAEAKVRINGKILAIILNQEKLEEAVIERKIEGVSRNELKQIEIPNLNSFSFDFGEYKIDKEKEDVIFSLSGSDTFIWYPDIELLKERIIGIHRDNVQGVFLLDPGIQNALLSITPPWIKYVPKKVLIK